MTKLHYLTALLLIVILAVMSGWFFKSIEKYPILTKEKLRHDPDYFLKNFTATTMDSKGKPAYQVKAKLLKHYPDDGSMALQQPLFSFYKNNIKTWTAQANEALISKNNKKIQLKGEVILNQIISANKSNSPLRLTAEQLTIEPEKNIAYTQSQIKLYKGNNTIQSLGMKANLNKNRIEFLSKTRSHYVLPAK